MNKQVEIKINAIRDYRARNEMLHGQQYLVVPVVILVQGVHHGSAGPVFYPVQELMSNPGAWNGRPVTLGHPPMGAGSPQAIEQFQLGTLFNTAFDEERSALVSEAWINISLTRQRAPELLDAFTNGKTIEVSTGLWFDESGGVGVWRNEEFTTTAVNFTPDHLALLPDAVGACSVADGCGIRNEKEVPQKMNKEGLLERALRSLIGHESKPEKVESMLAEFTKNRPGMVSTARALQRDIDALDRETPNGMLIHWLEEAFDDGTFIMRQEGPDGRKFFKGTFTLDAETDDVEMSNEFTEVIEQREFVEMEDTNINDDTLEEVATVNKEELVSALIACDKTHFNESHTEALMAMDEETLESLKANEPAPVADAVVEEISASTDNTDVDSTDTADPTEVEADKDVSAQTELEFINSAPEHLKEGLLALRKNKEEAFAGLVTKILAVENCKFTKEQLDNKDITELEAIEGLIGNPDTIENIGEPMGRPVSFAGRVGMSPETNTGDNGEPMGRPGLGNRKSA